MGRRATVARASPSGSQDAALEQQSAAADATERTRGCAERSRAFRARDVRNCRRVGACQLPGEIDAIAALIRREGHCRNRVALRRSTRARACLRLAHAAFTAAGGGRSTGRLARHRACVLRGAVPWRGRSVARHECRAHKCHHRDQQCGYQWHGHSHGGRSHALSGASHDRSIRVRSRSPCSDWLVRAGSCSFMLVHARSSPCRYLCPR